jgi:prepilin-type N-terminal cleavage/methylation domain-containing protein
MLTRPTMTPRRGFTLTELLLVIVIMSIVMGAIMNIILKQQRFYRGAAVVMDTRSQLRQAADIIPGDLRQISTVAPVVGAGNPAGSDILAANASGIAFRTVLGSSIACVVTANAVRLPPPDSLTRGATLTSFVRGEPVVGDVMFILSQGNNTGGADNQWLMTTITAVSRVATPCGAPTNYLTGTDVSREGYEIRFNPAIATTAVPPGMPVRFARRAEYQLYQATDTRWYLGYRECPGNVCQALQAVSGPYLPDAAPRSGAQFTYFDSLGAPTAVLGRISRVRVVLRGVGQEAVDLVSGGRGQQQFTDSVSFDVGIRNKR